MPMTDLYHVMIPGKLDILLEPDRTRATATLKHHFPDEAEGIDAFFDLVYRVFGEVIGAFYFKDPTSIAINTRCTFNMGLKPLQVVLDNHFRDPLLKTALTPYWTYMGLPPSQLSFIDMAAMLFAYIEFLPFHLKGGSQSLSTVLADRIVQCGGRIRYNCPVARILVGKRPGGGCDDCRG